MGEAGSDISGHGGELALAPLLEAGVSEIFTLSGGHVFPLYDACVKRDVPIYDVRHEQTATFAAEAVAKLTRHPAVAVLTAGPGVTNGVSAITTARFNGAPLVVLGGRAPEARWGAGSLQELDHVPIVASVTKLATTARTTAEVADTVAGAVRVAATAHRGPVFVDLAMDALFGPGQARVSAAAVHPGVRPEPDPDEMERTASLLAGSRRPVVVAGSDVWWDGAWAELAHMVEAFHLPTFANGLGRGCLASDHPLAFARTRSALKEADVVMVVGTPLDFRLSFGRFGSAQVVHVTDSPEGRAAHADLAAAPAGDLRQVLGGLAERAGGGPAGRGTERRAWVEELRQRESAARHQERQWLDSAADPIHPGRVYGELNRVLDRDAVVVCDGGDFVSFAGKFIDSYTPGGWLDPGPYGCLGTGMGYAAAARVVHPDRQVVAVLGDGAFGFSGMDMDTLVRHQLPVVMVMGNNGIWGLEKHPMKALYGYDVAADLQPECRYDQVVEALGGAGEVIRRPDDIAPALQRAFASGVPYLVNVLTDPAATYPRSSNLA